MRIKGELIAITAFILATAGVAIGVWGYEDHLSTKRNTVEIEARAVSTWSIKEIHLKKGQKARIRIRNVDNVSHGFAVPELGVEERIIRAGQVELVELTPQYAGEFVFLCVVQCSRDKHEFMRGKLIVTE